MRGASHQLLSPIAISHLPRENFGTWEFPVLHVRGGTSTGLIIWDRIAPKQLELREELLRHLMGLPLQGTTNDTKQITGLGRGYPTSNKVFFADMTTNAAGQPQIVSTLAQLAGGKSQIDWSVNCGNMSAALPYWAIDQHFLPRQLNGKGEVEIFNTNTKTTMIGRVTLAGDGFAVAQIPGVDGEFPGVDLFMANPVGAKTGKALPTGSAADRFGKFTVSCVDVAVPMVIARASEFGKTGTEPVKDLRNDETFFPALKKLWIEAGLKMGLKAQRRQTDDRGRTRQQRDHAESLHRRPAGERRQYLHPLFHAAGRPRHHGGHRRLLPCRGVSDARHRRARIARGFCRRSADADGNTGRYRKSGGHFVGHHRRPADQSETKISRAAYKRSAQILLRGYVPIFRASAALKQALRDIAANGAALAMPA